MLFWIYDVPALVVLVLFGTVFVGTCWLGIIFLCPRIKPLLHKDSGLNEILGDFLQYFGVIYGLLLGLLAVSTYQNHEDAERAVINEASALAALYRDISMYPEPYGSELKGFLKDYTRYVIDEAWPLQRIGVVPEGGVARIAAFHAKLIGFEPQTKAQEALHDASLRQFNTFYEYRRTRLYSVNTGIPPIMWMTVGAGAIINILLLWLFNLRRGTHLLLGGLISFFTATMICVIALLGNPYRGEVGIPPQAFELIYNQLMVK
ncbi:MAG TPA: hypothetical protein VIG52_07075 [Methyloceanibacter sp.]|jgi:hypothetical protein